VTPADGEPIPVAAAGADGESILVAAAGADGESILVAAADAYRVAFGARLIAGYALGSLAHGGFSPLVSDIDLGLIVADPLRPGDAEAIRAVADAERAQGSALRERLSVFWGTPATLRGERAGGRFPALDRLDLLENGRLLSGREARAGLSRPSSGELLIAGSQFALDFLAGVRGGGAPADQRLGSLRAAGEHADEEIRSPEMLLAHGVRHLTKLVLFPVRFLFTAATGHVGTNDAAVAHYLHTDDAPGRPLVAAALAWRTVPPTDDQTAVALLREQLLPLYLYYIEDHIARLEGLGQSDLAREFAQWGERLVR
jgi:hypothetical protein